MASRIQLLLKALILSSVLLEISLVAAVGITYNTNASVVPGKINVHLVAHTHDDVGWLKTVDQYYLGSNNSIQNAGVQYILNSVVASLQQNPDRKFIYVEQAFFQRWWYEQREKTRDVVRGLVSSGQLEFINGGWCMNDEAAAHYIDMIDQMSLGHLHILKEFGKVPSIGWQIDPFGHSAVQAYLLSAEVGFDGLFFGRIDYQDRAKRYEDKSLEVIWEGSKTFTSDSQIFTSVFPVGYGPPDAFQYEEVAEIPVQDDPLLFDVNVAERVEDFVKAALTQANVTRTNHVMWTMGTDFKYQIADKWFLQMDKLIHYVNKDGRVNALYSTPSLYLDAVHAANQSWPLKTEDFFPYADDAQSYWTGYFTSRSALKRYVRSLTGYLQAARQLEFFAGRKSEGPNTNKLWDAMSIAQHHDGVSGTSKQHVANDYAKRLAIGAAEAGEVMKTAVNALSAGNSNTSFSECPLLNVSYCPYSETIADGKTLVVTVYNALAWYRNEYIRLPVNSENLIVKDSLGKSLPSQLVPVSNTTARVRAYYVQANLGVTSGKPPKFWLYFKSAVPPLGFNSFYVSVAHPNETASAATVSTVEKFNSNADGKFEAGFNVKAEFSNGRLTSIQDSVSKVNLSVDQTYSWYAGYGGKGQTSGAYIFLPNGTSPHVVSDTVSISVIRGPLLEEVQQEFAPWVYQSSRLFKEKEHVEVEFIIGPIPVDDGVGKELITKFSTDIKANNTFYTDSNGRDFLKRIKDYRSDWELKVVQPVAGNYYPVNLGMYMTDNSTDFSVLVDRALGGGSVSDGELELMLHRRLVVDDSRGVGEPLNEVVCVEKICEGLTVQGQLYLSAMPSAQAAQWRRSKGQKVLTPLQLLFKTQDASEATYPAEKGEFSATVDGYTLPENVALITVLESHDGKVLVRLAHLYEAGEHPELSELASLELKKLFRGREIKQAVEVSLTANQEKAKMKPRFNWNVERPSTQKPATRGSALDPEKLIVELGPMEIRSFQLEFY